MRRTRAFGGLCLLVAAGWWLSGSQQTESMLDGEVASSGRQISSEFRDALGKAQQRSGRVGFSLHETQTDGSVVISGRVVDRYTSAAVGDVEVVFLSVEGEESVLAATDGTYRIELPPGAYRAFVRDDSVISVGQTVVERLPGFPDLDAVGAPDEAAMPLVVAQHDLDDVDLPVLRGGVVTGVVVDGAGRPVAAAVVRAFTSRRLKPALGTDLAETDSKGRYELRLPAGFYYLEANHPRYAGLEEPIGISVRVGDPAERDLTLVAGCVISGKVIGADGLAAGDGAIELGYEEGAYSPTGKILANGTFRWTTIGEQEIRLRAWPWKSPPSEAQTFACRDGARFDNVVFRLPQRGPDIAGLLVDSTGAPVPLAFIDLEPLDPEGVSQQERSDANGKWGVFAMPAGRYQVTAHAPGRGVVSTTITSPQANARLQLGGTGRLDGTVKGFTNGSLEISLISCTVQGTEIKMTEDSRLVSVRDGKFSIAGLPACDLTAHAKWRAIGRPFDFTIRPNGTEKVSIDFEQKLDEPVAEDPDDPHVDEDLHEILGRRHDRRSFDDPIED